MKLLNLIPPDPPYDLPFFQTLEGGLVMWGLIILGFLSLLFFVIIIMKLKRKKESEKT